MLNNNGTMNVLASSSDSNKKRRSVSMGETRALFSGERQSIGAAGRQSYCAAFEQACIPHAGKKIKSLLL